MPRVGSEYEISPRSMNPFKTLQFFISHLGRAILPRPAACADRIGTKLLETRSNGGPGRIELHGNSSDRCVGTRSPVQYHNSNGSDSGTTSGIGPKSFRIAGVITFPSLSIPCESLRRLGAWRGWLKISRGCDSGDIDSHEPSNRGNDHGG